jgi:hypothetical protein
MSDLISFSETIPVLELDTSPWKIDVENITSKIDGCLFPGEEFFLAQLAKSCIGKGVIVEIGSYLGRSGVSLGLGSLQGSRTMVFTFDHFEGDPFMAVTLDQFEILKRNVAKSGVDSIVLTSIESSDRAALNFSDPIELLFIDANHTFEAVEDDYLTWSPKVMSGGLVAFHDTYDPVMQGLRFDGPLRVIQKYCLSPEWKIVGRFQSITVVKKNGLPMKKVKVTEPVMSKSVQKRHKIQKGVK